MRLPNLTLLKNIMLLPVCMLLFSVQLLANDANSGIHGKVTTSEGQPAANVNVKLKKSVRGTTTAADGSYQIRNLNAGTYELEVSFIGYETYQETVTVADNEQKEVNIQLKLTQGELEEVIVQSQINSYKTNKLSSSLRLRTAVLETPQNIQIVTNKALADQQVISMSDGLVRNVSGAVRLEHWGDMYTNISSRGSQVQAFRNGFNVVSSYWGPLTEDMSFVDHIEFVKGPAGFMLSSGDPSGLYNVVTKRPTGQTKGEVSMTIGSFDLYRTALDLNGKLSKDGKLLYRLNMAAQNKKSHRANEYNDRYTLAPVISYQLDEQTKLTAEYIYQRANMSNVGSYYVFAPDGYAVYPKEFTMLPAGVPGTKINDHSASVQLDHKFNSDWSLTAQLAYYNYGQEGSSSWPSVVNADGTMIRNISLWDAKSRMTMGQAFVNGQFQTGRVIHKILGGLDLSNKEYFADWSQYHDLDTVGGEFDPRNPYLGPPNNGYPSFDRSLPIEQRATAAGGLIDQRYSSVYLQDEISFLDNRLRLTIAGRYTNIKQASYGGEPQEAKRFTPRFGLSASIDHETAVYALYDQAFTPQNGRLTNGEKVTPLTGNNIEFGIKKDWANGRWNTTVAVYRILKEHELVADPNSPPNSGFSIELGQKRSQGIEFDLRGTVARGLTLVANYALTESKVTRLNANNISGMKVGDYVPSYAKHTANAWLTYKVQDGALKGTGISAGFSYLGDRMTYWETPPAGGAEIPDYFKLDAGLFWEKKNVRVTGNVFNVLNKYLYSGSWYSWLNAYYWQSEAPRSLRLSVAYKF
jgi:iron complex outermembrane receptor protein